MDFQAPGSSKFNALAPTLSVKRRLSPTMFQEVIYRVQFGLPAQTFTKKRLSQEVKWQMLAMECC